MLPDPLLAQVELVREDFQRCQDAIDTVRWTLDADRRAADERRELLHDLMVPCRPSVVRLLVNVVCR